jgi:hypothetical protein
VDTNHRGKNGKALQLIAGRVRLLHGCIGRYVMHAGEVVLMLILAGVLTFSSCGCGSGFQLVGQSATHLVYVICISNVLKHLSFEFLFRFVTMLQDLPYDGDVPLATVGYLWTNIAMVHGNPGRRYTDYTNGLDCLQPSHVSDTLHHYYFLS